MFKVPVHYMYKLIVFVFNLQSIAENIYTIPEVVKEIKDKATLQRLQVLPYKIQYRAPSHESIRFGMSYCQFLVS